MVRCKKCLTRTRNPQNRYNWDEWQLCGKCAMTEHPGYKKELKLLTV